MGDVGEGESLRYEKINVRPWQVKATRTCGHGPAACQKFPFMRSGQTQARRNIWVDAEASELRGTTHLREACKVRLVDEGPVFLLGQTVNRPGQRLHSGSGENTRTITLTQRI